MTKRISKGPVWTVMGAGAVALISMALVLMYSLRPTSTNGIPPIKLGADKCDQCGMIISDIRYSVAVQSREPSGSTSFHTFDDIGCFLEYHQRFPNRQWNGVVHDHETMARIEIHKARFEQSDLHTPMGSGWIAHKEALNGSSFEELKSIVENQ